MDTGEPVTHPPAFRFRRGTSADLPFCAGMLPPGAKIEGTIRSRLVEIWDWLIEHEAVTFGVIEDLERPFPSNIEPLA